MSDDAHVAQCSKRGVAFARANQLVGEELNAIVFVAGVQPRIHTLAKCIPLDAAL